MTQQFSTRVQRSIAFLVVILAPTLAVSNPAPWSPTPLTVAPSEVTTETATSLVVCQLSAPKTGLAMNSSLRLLISDSDGFDVCATYGGKTVAGHQADRELPNVKTLIK